MRSTWIAISCPLVPAKAGTQFFAKQEVLFLQHWILASAGGLLSPVEVIAKMAISGLAVEALWKRFRPLKQLIMLGPRSSIECC